MKAVIVSWWSNHANKLAFLSYLGLIFFLPSQLGYHFWPSFSVLSGLRVDYLSPTLYFNDLFLLSLCLFLLPQLLKDVQHNRQGFFIGSLLLYLILGSLISVSPFNSLYGLLRWVGYGIVAYATARFVKEGRQLFWIVVVIGIAVLYTSILALLQFSEQHSLGGLLYYLGERSFSGGTPGIANASLQGTLVLRPYATFPHPNVLAGFLLISSIIIIACRSFFIMLRQQIIWGSVLFLGVGALFLTLSRSALVAIVVVALLWILHRGENTLVKIRQGLVLVILGGLLFLPLIPRFQTLTLSDESVALRLLLFKESWALFLSSPLFGIGIKNFLPVLSQEHSLFSQFSTLQPVHNVFMHVLVEGGLLIFFWALPFCLALFQNIQQSTPSSRVMKYSLLLAVLLIGAVDHYFYTLHQGQLLLAIVLGLLWQREMPVLTQPLTQNTRKPLKKQAKNEIFSKWQSKN